MNKLSYDDGSRKYVTLGEYGKAKAKKLAKLVKSVTSPKVCKN